MNTPPLVTVIAVCYNHEKWIVQALDSIKNQTHKNIQLIVADDGSRDNSKQVIANWIQNEYPEAIFINHKANVGLTKNLNSALPYIKGDYWQAFGCDDIMLPGKLALQVTALESNKKAGVVFSDMYFIDRENNRLPGSYFEKHTYKQPRSGWIYEDLIDRFIISAPAVLIKTEVLDKVHKYDEKLDYEDHDFFLKAAKYFEYIYMEDKLVEYRISGQSLTATNTDVKFYKNSFLIYYQNFDSRKEYKPMFTKKLLFYVKNLYNEKYKYTYNFCMKAFAKTGNTTFIKYGLAGLRFYFTSKKA